MSESNSNFAQLFLVLAVSIAIKVLFVRALRKALINMAKDREKAKKLNLTTGSSKQFKRGESTSDFPFFNDRRKNLPFNERNVECLPAEKAYYIPFPFFLRKEFNEQRYSCNHKRSYGRESSRQEEYRQDRFSEKLFGLSRRFSRYYPEYPERSAISKIRLVGMGY